MLREIAEYPNSFGPLGPRDERIETDRYTLWMGSGKNWNTVQRQRLDPDEIDETLDEVRTLLRERGRDGRNGRSAARRDRRTSSTGSSSAGSSATRSRTPWRSFSRTHRRRHRPEIVARRVESFDEYAAANAVQWEAFETPADEIEESRAKLEERWNETVNVMHAAWLDGEIVAAGTSAVTEHGLLLYGGATSPRARGRGAYRAVLNARWEEAVATARRP